MKRYAERLSCDYHIHCVTRCDTHALIYAIFMPLVASSASWQGDPRSRAGAPGPIGQRLGSRRQVARLPRLGKRRRSDDLCTCPVIRPRFPPITRVGYDLRHHAGTTTEHQGGVTACTRRCLKLQTHTFFSFRENNYVFMKNSQKERTWSLRITLQS
jgi:hypothetical protein